MSKRSNASFIISMAFVGAALGCKVRDVPVDSPGGDPAAAGAREQAWTEPEDLLNESVYREPKEQSEVAEHQHAPEAAEPAPVVHDHGPAPSNPSTEPESDPHAGHATPADPKPKAKPKPKPKPKAKPKPEPVEHDHGAHQGHDDHGGVP